ncbi:MAG TPA: L,D-transpeptidase [Rhizomicrobium sp.]|nr:L,D-transpeptidase [Rhizomicrobium sp.]
MSALRQLSGIYVAAASFYGVVAILSLHPGITESADLATRDFTARTAVAANAVDVALAGSERTLAIRGAAAFEYALEMKRALAKTWSLGIGVSAVVVRLDLTAPSQEVSRSAARSRVREGSNKPAPGIAEVVASGEKGPQFPTSPAPRAADLVRVKERLKDSLTRELYGNFELFLYVSKAVRGPWAQRMYVFQKNARSDDLALLYNWPVSTGRERIEYNSEGRRLPSYTPAGYYELDPRRSYRHHFSLQWHQPMPYAMFFNWVKSGMATGLAIHGATGRDVALLGSRASAGCVRLAPQAARTLFTLIRAQYRGLAPRFAIDRRSGTMSNDGTILHDANGRPNFAEGYKVLVFIENYGGANEVAALY